MLFLLSPAKSLDYQSSIPDVPHTLPAFVDDATRLIEVLRRKSPQDLSSLMDISDPLATLNAARYQAWTPKFTQRNARQAVLAFDGDVYDGPRTWNGRSSTCASSAVSMACCARWTGCSLTGWRWARR
jgi:cytoplasmic iron level regulating protein YaaA (DUF328/UPF0246 family)